MDEERWPGGFVPPADVPVPFGHRLRPVRVADVARHRVAVPGSGEADLRRLEAEAGAGLAWTYVLLDTDETAILGGVRVEPGAGRPGSGWSAWWWLVSECVGTDLAAAFDDLVPRWLVDHWPNFRQ